MRVLFAVIGVVVGFIGFGISPVSGFVSAVALVVSGIIIGLFGIIMPTKTKKGALTKEYILGLKRYLTVAEKDRLKFHNAPEKNPEHFDALLPYAMALKVADQWAKQFAGLERENPNWYEGPVGYHFVATGFAKDLASFSSTLGSNLSSTASGGGSGFSGGSSGGGFGGGGGGSW